jgi:hypothetical protein
LSRARFAFFNPACIENLSYYYPNDPPLTQK